MSTRTINLTDEIVDYLINVTVREPELLARLRAETAEHPDGQMQISAEQGQFMRLLIEITGAYRAIEIGTFTGYSALCVALALPPEGELIACDVSEEYTAIARRYWQEAGVADKIDLRIAPALETIDALLAEGQAESFDFAFIDADKTNGDNYYERCLKLLRTGGLVAIDNALSAGRVVKPTDAESPVPGMMDALNRKISTDDRVTSSLVPIGDGLMIARKR